MTLDDIIESEYLVNQLIAQNEPEQALSKIEKLLKYQFDLQDDEQEKLYEKFIGLRVSLRLALGKKDEIIQNHVRMEKYPNVSTFNIGSGHTITLRMKNFLLTNSDAYVNTVSVKNPFDKVSDMSSSMNYIRVMGLDEIHRQVKEQNKNKKGEYFILDHPKFSAPQSYHIMLYDDGPIDYSALKKGIRGVLLSASKCKLKSLGFIPLGYDYVFRAPQEAKDTLAIEIANRIAQVIIEFLHEYKKEYIPEIFFNFVKINSMQCFDRAFHSWGSITERDFYIRKQYKDFEQKIIDDVKTKNTVYSERIKKIAYSIPEKTSILLLGETGVGKSYIAKIIHQNSRVNDKDRFIYLNCNHLSSELVLSQLFGWVKGAYTGATSDGHGYIEQADNGTLFLDEIGNMSLDAQKKILDFLDSGEYSRLGEQNKKKKANVRLIFGTNNIFKFLIKRGLFLPDLYERISQQSLEIPPLRERSEDIPEYIKHFLQVMNTENNMQITIQEETIKLLSSYYWPGNIRQLKFYFGSLYDKTKWDEKLEIHNSLILADPPRNKPFESDDPIAQLENVFFSLLNSPDFENENLLKSIIQPVLAKVFIEDYEGEKSNASKRIGIDGSNGKKATLNKLLNLYDVKFRN